MKSYRIGSLLLVATLVFILSSCTKKEDDAQKAVEQASKSMQQMAQNMAGGANGAANKTPGVAVPAKTLAGFLPSVSGYTAKGEPETMEMEMAGSKYSHATQEYQNGDKRIKVNILDYNYIAGLSAAYGMMMNMSLETNEESMHSEKFNGNPGWVDWKKKSNNGTVGVVVADRIYVIVEAEEGASLDELKSVANSINYSGIASAAK
jgi:protein involved in sex pheromone biosynthesis